MRKLLQKIHDEADHIINTDATNHREVAIKDAREIRRLAKKALRQCKRKSVYSGANSDGADYIYKG